MGPDRERLVRRYPESADPHPPVPATTPVPAASLTALAGAAGNRAFGQLLAAGGTSADVATPAVQTIAGPTPAGQTTAVQTPATQATAVGTATQATQTAGTWVTPEGVALTSTVQAGLHLVTLRDEAQHLQQQGLEDFGQIIAEATARIEAIAAEGAARPLTAFEGRQLTWFGRDYADRRERAVQAAARAVIAQLSAWLNPPITEAELFELEEYVHAQFIASADPDRITRAAALLKDAKDAVDRVKTWTGRAARAAKWLETAKYLQDLNAGVQLISGYVSEASKLTALVRDIGRTVGALGGTPAGVDELTAMEGALSVIDFVVSAGKVPGLDLLWDYIGKGARACLTSLRSLRGLLYTRDRSDAVAFFFDQHRNDEVAPRITDAAFHGDSGQHFPGGQPVFDLMWAIMRTPDAVTAVPDTVEDYFVTWRRQLGAGEQEQLATDSSWRNGWNVLSRERAPGLLDWVRRNRSDLWVKLYGGMPAPH